MTCDAYWDEVDLRFETVSAIVPRPGSTWNEFAHYPAPLLRRTGSIGHRTFRLAVLENEFMRVDVAPSLGGRIIGIYDKTSTSAILPIPETLKLASSGSTHGLEYGVWWSSEPGASPFALDSVEAQLLPAEEDRGPASIVLFGLNPVSRNSWHAAITLEPGSSEIGLVVSVLNRDLRPAPAALDVRINLGPDSEPNPAARSASDPARRATLAAFASAGELSRCEVEGNSLVIGGFADGDWLAPRQSERVELRLLPAAGMPKADASGHGCLLALESGKIRVYSAAEREAKLVIRARGQTLESKLELKAGGITDADLTGIGAVECAAIVEGGQVVATTQSPETAIRTQSHPRDFDGHAAFQSRDDAFLRQASKDLGLKHISYCVRAAMLAQDGRFREAAEVLDSALAFNAEDPLTWWFKAAVTRLAGEDSEDMPEMPNAHYLAPLEPVLRAEAFLSQPPQGEEPNPLVKPLAPDSMLEVANLLLESGLQADAARWLDECLRHDDAAMFRYLLAWMLLSKSKMKIEAATHVSAAAKLEIAAPYPSRPHDFLAIRGLAKAFPEDVRLTEWLEIVEAFSQPRS